jgi:putative pyruvate formate lyase activating enzyme
MQPAYLHLAESGELERRVESARERLAACTLCPRQCGVNRLEDQLGVCRTGRRAKVASYHLHFGEESPLVGDAGSGTVFFAMCNLGCIFCQNADISHLGEDAIAAQPDELAGVMLALARQGAANINFVTPSHVVPQILEALPIAVEHGLRLPLVYNSSGYDEVETLKLLDGVVDMYMPDVKAWDPEEAARLLTARDYPEKARQAVLEMHRQVGDLEIGSDGLARHGLLVRHLVLPEGKAGTDEWMRFLAEDVSPETYLNVMDQYRPCHKAFEAEGVDRSLTAQEYREAKESARRHGLQRLDNRGERFWRRLGP